MSLTTRLIIRDKLVDSPPEQRQVARAIFNPDPESEFARKSVELRRKYRDNHAGAIKALSELGYDIMLGYNEGNIIGHMSFQEHQAPTLNWQMFDLQINPEHRGNQYSVALSEEFLNTAKRYNIPKIRMGAGGHPIMSVVLTKLKTKEAVLGVRINLDDHWVYLTSQQSQP